jgi:fanconi anemia group M protein
MLCAVSWSALLNFEMVLASGSVLDPVAAQQWIFPNNYPIREYQRSIVEKALFQNTLVSLPTGMGKTLIAAVVMYNYYRWYPNGKIIFLAPTKPLVAQQMSACYDIVGIPENETAHFDGSCAVAVREGLWHEKRVFFCTPQVSDCSVSLSSQLILCQTVDNDIQHNRCPVTDIVCLVIDEAHRATGNYAYVKLVC